MKVVELKYFLFLLILILNRCIAISVMVEAWFFSDIFPQIFSHALRIDFSRITFTQILIKDSRESIFTWLIFPERL